MNGYGLVVSRGAYLGKRIPDATLRRTLLGPPVNTLAEAVALVSGSYYSKRVDDIAPAQRGCAIVDLGTGVICRVA